jgi:hypothetical protein
MQPFLSQALLATRIAEMHREAADRAARWRPEAARRRARQARAQVRPATPSALRSANAQQARSVHANRVTHAGRTGG